MIKRYRNSPSIIIWSIGNEEWLLQDSMAEQGTRIATSMVERYHRLDPTRVVSCAVNGDNENGVSVPLDFVGFNYNTRKYPETFHKKYPLRPVFGSETSSALSTRGVYSTDPLWNTMSSYDGVAGWGETPEQWWSFYGSREWEAGGFAWTGFDYRGEPTPYGWPSISSQFGIVDTCGFPKDYFFYYKAWWTKRSTLHLFPHWTWHGREGDEIPVWVYSNLDEVELFVNEKSEGKQRVSRLGHISWNVRFETARVEARGYREGKLVLSEVRETAGALHRLRVTADRSELDADGEDVAMLRVEALDREGRFVPTANQLVSFNISGPGRLIGVGNGDPNCLESDKGSKRSLFNGLAQVIVRSSRSPGIVMVEATLDGHPPISATCSIATKSGRFRPYIA